MYLQQKIKNTNMKVFRAEHLRDGNFTRVNNGLLDGHLSSDAAIMLIFILSLPEDWYFNIEFVANNFNWSTSKVSKLIKELKEKGHMKSHQTRFKNGDFGECFYEVFEKSNEAQTKINKPNVKNGYTINGSTKNDATIEASKIKGAKTETLYFQGLNGNTKNGSTISDKHINTINTNTYINTIKPSEKIEPKKETPQPITEIKPLQKTQEVKQIENKLKDIGIQNTKYLFNNFSLDVIKRQIDYFAYKDEYKRTAGALVNAIKIDEEAPEEFKREMIRIEHNNYKHKYRHSFREFASNVGVNKTTLQDHFFWNITDALNEIGLLDTNNSAQNQENKFKYDEEKFKTLEARIQKCLTDITYTDFLTLVDDCLKTFSNVPQIDKKHIFKREILNGNINTFNYKKALSKFNLNKSEVI